MRDKPGQFGLVGANGGIMSKYSVGIYSTTPLDWRPIAVRQINEDIAALPKVEVTEDAGWYRDHRDVLGALRLADPNGVIVGRLDSDDAAFMATTEDDDLVALMSDGDPLGAAISVTSDGETNTAKPA